MRFTSLLLLTLTVCALNARAEETCAAGHGLDATALAVHDFEQCPPQPAASDARFTVRSLEVTRQDVFPVDRHWLARQANRFHPLTRENAVRAQLPFASGEAVTLLALTATLTLLVSLLGGIALLLRPRTPHTAAGG